MLPRFLEYIKNNHLFTAKDKLLLAVSGGLDSVVLCALCHQAKFDFVIAHCNFQLRGEESNRDEKFVEDLAKKYNVEFFVKRFETEKFANENKLGIEEAARNLRYEWFLEIREEYLANRRQGFQPLTGLQPLTELPILTAHHANDNIETLLMNFFKGTGIKGLRGMQQREGLAKVVRPLLFATRNEIEQFAKANNLSFVEDSSNKSNDYTRNYFRNGLLPSIKEKFVQVEENLMSNIERFKDVEILYQQAIEIHKKNLLEQKGNEFHIPVLKLLQAKPLKTILYEIVQPFNFSSKQINDIINLTQSESGKYVESNTHKIIRNRKWLIISPKQKNEAQHILIEEGDKEVNFLHGILKFEIRNSNFEILTSNLIATIDLKNVQFPLLLRQWKQGDYFYPLGMQKKKKLSKFFIDNKLSIVDKEKIWVIESNKKIVWVIGLRIDERFKVIANTKEVLEIGFKHIGK